MSRNAPLVVHRALGVAGLAAFVLLFWAIHRGSDTLMLVAFIAELLCLGLSVWLRRIGFLPTPPAFRSAEQLTRLSRAALYFSTAMGLVGLAILIDDGRPARVVWVWFLAVGALGLALYWRHAESACRGGIGKD